MKLAFNNIALMGRWHTEGVVDTLTALEQCLKDYDLKIYLEESTAKLLPKSKLVSVPCTEIHKHCDLIIVVGGDGSLLNAAHIGANQNLPVLGINRGTLGFLTDIHPTELNKVCEVITGAYIEEERFLLTAKIRDNGNILATGDALNDVVLLPGDIARLTEFTININNKFVCDQRADGLIVATPTGSTAHALAGGGPILYPKLNALVLLPMFPHNLSSRPIVVDGDSEIELIISKQNETSVQMSCDGGEKIPLPPGGRIVIKKNPNKLRLIHPKDYHYYATLRAKLNWETRC